MVFFCDSRDWSAEEAVGQPLKDPNRQTKVVMVHDVPILIFIAKTDIGPGSELLYEYGDMSKKDLKGHSGMVL